ncbi:iron complex outermembrane receptor protein [Dyadobacter jejuensis]|uniref:Iron complex outermembrane receptor protein n=1 Tax=Dyadobacter jejuensis TaxID=1082580 RepID=A0A316AQH4_9BACT|nr:TonB-dependent receptor [Dyadobacter jejuensis]PWJ59529.1 iron complex outermembrane receptor protein [Dyadobacter jejuensis]
MKTVYTILWTALLGIAPIFTQAQEIALDPVTITAGLIEKRASETGRNIAVIKGSYFKHLPVNSIDELLRYIPGLEIQSRGPMGSQSDIVMRGGTFQQVLVIMDGIRLNDPNTGHFNSYIPITPSEIDRIEVLKGASSAIYGSEAVGGVVQVISKTFAARLTDRLADGPEKSPPTFALDGSVALGEYGLRNVNAGGFLQTDRLALSAGLLSNNAAGVLQRGARGYFHNHTASVSGQYAISEKWKLAARSAYDSRDFAAQNFYTVFASDTAQERVSSVWNQVRVSHQMERSSLTIDAGYKHVKDHYRYNPQSTANESVSTLWQGLVLWQNELSENLSLVTGLNYQNKAIASNDRGHHNLHQLAPLATLTARLTQHLTVSPALRLDWRQYLGAELVPQLNVSYKRAAWQFRASAGKTIRDADFTERYNNYGKSLVTGGNVGNPNLSAERSFSYEAGADWFVGNSLKLSGTYFQRAQNNLIDYIATAYADMPRQENLSSTGTFGLASNIAKVNITGWELDAQWNQPISENQQLRITTGLSWLRSQSSSSIPSFYVSSHAKFLGNFSVLYSHKNLNLAINGLYKQREPREALAIASTLSESYFVLNSKIDCNLPVKNLKVFFEINNLLNRTYSDLLGASMPGRWLAAGIKFNMNRP